jgi:peptide/nickel transport system ATP-binding protein
MKGERQMTENSSVALLELNDVKKWFPVRRNIISELLDRNRRYVKAVDGVSLTVQRGEILGLVGESGSGKSTLGELIVRLQEPTHGGIKFDGTDITHIKPRNLPSFRRGVQIIFQDPYATLNPRFTIFRTIAEPLIVNRLGDQNAMKERVKLALKRAGLNPDDKLLGSYPFQLSGGQRQRVAIARAIDEPVSMLDVSIRSGILNLLRELRDSMGLTIIFVSHDLSTVQYLCDRIAIMYLGNIVEIGPTASVIGNALHPYSRALLNAVPVIDPDMSRERMEITGELPNAMSIPAGCRFASRCPFVQDDCRQVEPELAALQQNHLVRCIYPQFTPMWNNLQSRSKKVDYPENSD